MMKTCLIALLVCIFLHGPSLKAQRDTLKKVRFYVQTGLILNRAYSQFTKPSGNYGRSGYSYSIQPLGSTSLYTPGVSVGANMHVRLSPKRDVLVSASLVSASCQYKELIHFVEKSDQGTAFYSIVDIKNDVYKRLMLLNLEVAVKGELAKNFFVQHGLVTHMNVKESISIRGVRAATNYTTYLPGAPPNLISRFEYVTTEIKNDYTYDKIYYGISYRPSLMYKFYMRQREFYAYLYRNISLQRNYSRPWWSFGVLCSL